VMDRDALTPCRLDPDVFNSSQYQAVPACAGLSRLLDVLSLPDSTNCLQVLTPLPTLSVVLPRQRRDVVPGVFLWRGLSCGRGKVVSAIRNASVAGVVVGLETYRLVCSNYFASLGSQHV
jgi:hypothetical protein